MRRLVWGFLVIVVLAGVAAGAVAVWLRLRNPLSNHRPVGGVQVDVSHNDRVQEEAAIAIDPSNPRIMLAGSNDRLFVTRVYTTTNGGAHWRSAPGPPLVSRRNCGDGDPAVAVDQNGREYYAFLAELECFTDRPHLFVSTRPSAKGRWRTSSVASSTSRRFIWDDKPSIVIDESPGSAHRGRVYLAWSRLENPSLKTLETSHSDDHGRTWATPVPVGRDLFDPLTSSIAVGLQGKLYVVAADVGSGTIWLARSVDGGAHFQSPRRVATTRPVSSKACEYTGFALPAQAGRCIESNPTIVVFQHGLAAGQAVVTYSSRGANGSQDVFASGFNSSLEKTFTVRVSPPDRGRSDQFLPATAFDLTTASLWTCFYDTTGDSSRKHAWYTCAVSRDGGKVWSAPLRAASVASDESQYAADSVMQYGDYEGLAAADGIAHPIWTDTRDLLPLSEEIFTSAVRLNSPSIRYARR